MTLADAGYHSGIALDECARRGQRVVVPDPQQKLLQQQPYRKDLFTYDEGNDCYYCPQGQTLSFVKNKPKRGMTVRMYRASGSVCRECPAFGVCTRDGTEVTSIGV